MPQTPHIEKQFTASEAIRDIVIGMSDGLTAPCELSSRVFRDRLRADDYDADIGGELLQSHQPIW